MHSNGVILYVEDEETDAFFVQRAFQQAGVDQRLVIASNGQEGIDYLCGNGGFADRTKHPLPLIVLLDLNMPGVSGLEVLKWIRSTPAVCTLVVIVLTSSNQESDVQRAYRHGA